MCQYSSTEGGPTDFHLVHLGKFAMGGAGIVFCEATSVGGARPQVVSMRRHL
jgi:2,4-dienoyl-CoA reductase-like NADH-dependent reductase (Old Yellow Enzyme family)